ncbi:NAD(P)/FAD-dependent oxidoreductase [Christensenella intestinihominis]|uniref:NAD(P)/FAD-dependent oxidoreductase n=1 Tax=Christensenella intestinihominis TaxID=1851429 RepID=UPI000835BC4D|nr:FAD-dependent oxidoreductase [Christensenella intestinihominis]
MKYVIIGNSAAAIGCIEGIRQQDKNGEITVIAGEPHHTYSRPAISYLLCGKTTEERMKYRPDDFYQKMNCTVMLGRNVTRIEPEEKWLFLEDGTAVEYDKLLIATGSRPFVPGIEGLEGVKEQYTFMSLDDAMALDEALGSGGRVLIMGAGLIGLKCAEGIARKAGSIDVVDLADRILPSILDAEAARPVQEHIEKQGIQFHLGDGVQKFKGNTAVLSSGKEIGFDILVVAVGVRPNVELAREAGIEVRKGIVTDERCGTSLPDIYAAGDCTESYDITTGEHKPLALLPNAYMQGECAGFNMAGSSKTYDRAIPMNAIGFFDLHMITAGSYDGECFIRKNGGDYKMLVSKDGVLKGFILIGDVARAGIYTSLIREQTPLETVDYELIKEKPQLMAFSRTERAKKLGGAAV